MPYSPKLVTKRQLVEEYVKTQVGTVDSILAHLTRMEEQIEPEGFVLLRNVVMDSAKLGDQMILAYGPDCTYKSLPDTLVLTNGLPSSTSKPVLYCLADQATDQDQPTSEDSHA